VLIIACLIAVALTDSVSHKLSLKR
jgi:hypothetical protein